MTDVLDSDLATGATRRTEDGQTVDGRRNCIETPSRRLDILRMGLVIGDANNSKSMPK